MKKRILGLALALIMIISLLPMATFAAAPASVKCVLYNGATSTGSVGRKDIVTNAGGTNYLVTQAIANSTMQDVVQATTTPTTNYVKLTYADGIYTMTFKDFTCTSATLGGDVCLFVVNTGGEYDIKVVLEGTNTITTTNGLLAFSNAGNVTITGDGSLNVVAGSSADVVKNFNTSSSLTIKNTTVKIEGPSGSSQNNCFNFAGDILVEGSTVECTNPTGAVFRTATHRYNNRLAAADAEIIIKNSTVVAKTKAGSNQPVIDSDGKVTIENSNVTLSAAQAKNSRIARTAPYLVGTYSTKKIGDLGYDHKDFKSDLKDYDLTSGAAIDAGNVRYLEVVHQCVAVNPDTDCTTADLCACGKNAVEAKQHIPGANADDCTKDTICGNDGCTGIYAAKTHDAHVPGADDGNCLTPVKCANCDQNATAAAEAHTGGTATCTAKAVCAVCGSEYGEMLPHTGGTATCTAKAKCSVCTQEYGELAAHTPKAGEYACNENHPCANPDCDEPYRKAGTHVGGGTEATCEKKAVCKCGEEYGELAACKPAADDGDCTTAIKCSVCGKVTTAGEAAHKYTDKKDTTCDNAGCTNTRKVESGTTENPKTGDNTVLVLALSLMAASAAAFVCTKKFAR